jgi:hypothetical protein
MGQAYSTEIVKELSDYQQGLGLHCPVRVGRYEVGDVLSYEATEVAGKDTAGVGVKIERFVGGGFAGQVYQVAVTGIEKAGSAVGSFAGLEVGKLYAMKILIPPSGFSVLFRNFVYALGFQGPFQLQVNPAAARSGALWQKFIRRAAKLRFGREDAVNDIHVTFVDSSLGSCGELSDWVSGRTWRLEVDEHLDTLKRWKKGKPIDPSRLGSPEFRAKHDFMQRFVELLHEMGAHEFARQYEWSTCKSQPNCLKRLDTADNPETGLVAVDFRAGLALLPYLPMSPGDFKLIGQGAMRGSLVQFDRGDLAKLEQFVAAHKSDYGDMLPLLSELKVCEEVYRNSLPDVTHNGVRLFYDGKLWKTMLSSAVTGWRVRNLIDGPTEQQLRGCPGRTMLFFVLGLLPFLGRVLRKAWGRPEWRQHYASILTSPAYFVRALRGHIAEVVTHWYRAGRVNDRQAQRLARSIPAYAGHWLLSWITPTGIHRFIADSAYRKDALWGLFVRPFQLYFNAELRIQWMRDMVEEGKKKHILTEADAATIESQLLEPYIQKYLISLVVHLLTLFVSETVYVAIGAWYWFSHPDLPQAQRVAMTAGVVGLINLSPVSPGSLCRGLYVLWLMIRERDYRNYSIALYLGVCRIVGYLAFPIQMAYRYPAMARFMASHWATDAVHSVPVFGERGALLEHAVFGWCYNWPLTIRRRMQRRAELRATAPARYWPAAICAAGAGTIWMTAEAWQAQRLGEMPTMWALGIVLPAVMGMVVTLAAGGAALWKRIVAATAAGAALAVLTAVMTEMVTGSQIELAAGQAFGAGAWRVIPFMLFAAIGAMVTEIGLPDPDLVC